MKIWHPWRTLRDHYAHLHVHHRPLRPNCMGVVVGSDIVLHDGLTQAERFRGAQGARSRE